MLYHDRIAVSEDNDVNKTSAKSVLFVSKGIFWRKSFCFNWISVMGTMMF